MATVRSFIAGDVVQLALQPSQRVTLGVLKEMHSIEDGLELEAAGPAWTAIGTGANAGRILCCYGFAFQFAPSPGFTGHALAWAMLSEGIGAAHVAITRFARGTIADSPIARIEAIVRDDVAAECRWAEMVGLEFCAMLPCWGPEGRTHRLYHRIRATAAPALREAA